MTKNKRPKIGLALGSGGAKGLAHIGIIRVLEKNNIPIDYIAGSSIGALIGGFYATFKNINKVEEIALSTNLRQIFSLLDPTIRSGLLSGDKLKKFFEKQIGKTQFEDLKIPLSAIATDIETGEMVCLNAGEVALAIRASVSFPLVFKPVKYKQRQLADGGLSLPVPVKIVKDMGADFIIAVNTEAHYFRNGQSGQNNKIGFLKIANNSLNILRYQLSVCACQEADILITPKLDGNIYWDKFLNAEKIIKAGEEAAINFLPKIKELIK